MIRDITAEDFTALKKLHGEMNLNYSFPNLESPLFLVKKVQETEHGIVAAMALRLNCEAFWMGKGSVRQKLESMKALQSSVLREAWGKGIDDVVAVIPPEALKSGRWLNKLGWSEDRPWPMYSRSTENE